jgi:hypothetical protein
MINDDIDRYAMTWYDVRNVHFFYVPPEKTRCGQHPGDSRSESERLYRPRSGGPQISGFSPGNDGFLYVF